MTTADTSLNEQWLEWSNRERTKPLISQLSGEQKILECFSPVPLVLDMRLTCTLINTLGLPNAFGRISSSWALQQDHVSFVLPLTYGPHPCDCHSVTHL